MNSEMLKKLTECDELVKKLNCQQLVIVQEILHRNASLIQSIVKTQKESAREVETNEKETIVTLALSIQELNSNLNKVINFSLQFIRGI